MFFLFDHAYICDMWLLFSPLLCQTAQFNVEHFSGMHNWYACSHARPTFCNVCKDSLSGVTSHGLSCEGEYKYTQNYTCLLSQVWNSKTLFHVFHFKFGVSQHVFVITGWKIKRFLALAHTPVPVLTVSASPHTNDRSCAVELSNNKKVKWNNVKLVLSWQ